MFFLNENPFVKIIVPFIFGILFVHLFNPGFIITLVLGLALFIFLSIDVFFKMKYNTFHNRWVSGLFFCLFFLFAGASYTAYVKNNSSGLGDEEWMNKPVNLIVRIDDDVEVRQNSVKTIVKTYSVLTDSKAIEFRSRMMCYFQRDSSTEQLRYGDRLIIKTYINHPNEAMNPGSFDFRSYLALQGIHYTAWIGEGKWKILKRDEGNTFIAASIKYRNKVLQVLQKQLGDSDEYKVAAAIVTGYRAGLDSDLRQTFSNAGAMHVMCVSGLHVGIVFLIISFFLRFLNNNRLINRIIKVLIILIVIWFYAMLTGFSASVLRASTMFSFVALAMIVNRKVPIYNSLAASALFLLLINPMFIFQPGFQLSYLAVIGIVALFPYIQKIIPAGENKLITRLRDLIAVSIAAQIATAPISLYYFNQFPNYFIITNIIVVPLAGFIIYSAIPALMFANVSYAGDVFGFILGFLVKSMNVSVAFINNMPGSVTQNIYINFIQMLLIYAIIVLLFHGLIKNNKKLLTYAMVSLLLVLSLSSYHSVKKMNHVEMISPYGLGATYVFVENRKCIVITDDVDKEFERRFKNSMGKYLTENRIKEVEFLYRDQMIETGSFYYKYPFIQFLGNRILIYDKKWKISHDIDSMSVSHIFLEKSPFVKFDELSSQYGNPMFIYTSDNKKSTVNIWDRIVSDDVKSYNVVKSGAFLLSESK